MCKEYSAFTNLDDIEQEAMLNKMTKCQIWHSRFGHLNYEDLEVLQKQNIVDGIDVQIKSNNSCKI